MSGVWDQEVIALKNDVNQLLKQAENIGNPRDFSVVEALRNEVDEKVSLFVVHYDRMNHLLRKKWQVSRAHDATLYWSKRHLAKTKILMEEFLGLQNRKMWLRLLQVRFSNAVGTEKATLEARHLVDLVLRRQQLTQAEKAMNEELNTVAIHRQKLRGEYEKISAADQNWQASVSMQSRLGVNLKNAADHPSIKAFKDLLKIVSVPLRHPDEEKWLTSVNQELEKKSEALMDQCKNLAAAYVQKGESSYDTNSLNKFKNTINQVNDLNVEITKKMQNLLSERIRPARPKMVQRATKKAKTDDHSLIS